MENSNNSNLEQTLQDGNLYRQVNGFIVAHLRDNNLNQAANAVASATLTPLNVESPPNKLLELVAKVQQYLWVTVQSQLLALLLLISVLCMIQKAHQRAFRSTRHGIFQSIRMLLDVQDSVPMEGFLQQGAQTRQLSSLRYQKSSKCCSQMRGMFLFDLSYGHFMTIYRFFDFSKTVAKRAFRVIQDTHNVRSVSFHPSGDFVLAGTDHSIAHLYDVNTFQCYLSAKVQEIGVNGAINQVRYSSTGGMYVTASKDGAVRIWDGVTANCVRAIVGAHSTTEVISANFTKDQRFVLSCGKDSSVKLWEVGTGRLVKQYLGATHTQLRCQAVFNDTEEFVLCMDEPSNEIVIWDAITTEKVARWPSNHVGAPRWLEHSPTEAAFVSCGNDRSVRFWKELL